MVIFKQNRCIALLVGVILVCFSAISLMSSEGAAKGKNTVQWNDPQPKGQAAASTQTSTILLRTNSTSKPMLYTTAANLVQIQKLRQTVEWISPKKLKLPSAAVKTDILRQKAAVVKTTPPVAQQAPKKAAAKGSQTVNTKNTAIQQHPPTKLFFSRTKLLSQEQRGQATWSYAVSEEDLLLLQKIVMAEAEGEPYQGKVAVANVVLNRLRSANFPDTIYEVIYQKSQFSPVANGRLKRVKPNEDSIKAVAAALSGTKAVTDDTYFFLSLTLAQDLTVHHSRQYAKTIGNHTFYK
ncbi:cell wall hydrolase [Paenibacillus sp. S150]|uniref:cell wall hydrolase n=1 Tax=Paenibacillus sp. S150 TaxID=2749826 RepID=UPI001C56BEE7|nr:cell wall hydrolase [Paenibacillus sp. S150]MBW4081397.1 cell wall hydrolase [Paenibacillus sp. S150]